MPLPDHRIIEWAKAGGIRPFVEKHVNPASLDLCVGKLWRDLERPDAVIYADEITIYPRTISTELYNFIAKIFGMKRRLTAVMAITEEWLIIPSNVAAMLKLKSTPIREGLGYPIADWIDPGYSGRLTMLLTANRKITIHAGQRLVQIVLERMAESCETPYYLKGHYNNQLIPTLAWREDE